MGQELVNEAVYGRTGFHEHHNATWRLQFGDQVLDGFGTQDTLALGLVRQKCVHLFDGTIESNDGESVIGHVQDEILAHYGQADEADVPFSESV